MSIDPANVHLLVVDDNEPNRDMLSRRMRVKGYRVTVAASGQEALDLTEVAHFDLVLLDIEMPGLSGVGTLQRLRKKYSNDAMPIIMVTAHNKGADVVEALEHGASDYVVKPIDFPLLLARVELHLSRRGGSPE
jgi:DNA-binding response OmpR family regulator